VDRDSEAGDDFAPSPSTCSHAFPACKSSLFAYPNRYLKVSLSLHFSVVLTIGCGLLCPNIDYAGSQNISSFHFIFN
jgi:hypothetical protein